MAFLLSSSALRQFCFLGPVAIALGLFSGCHSVVTKILPDGFAPVTKERCESLNLEEIGKNDALVGHRSGDRFDFWVRDCKSAGVELDRERYNQGFESGLKIYCSCEEGFKSSARGEFEELRGQYQACGKKLYQEFMRGRDLGLTQVKSMKAPDREKWISELKEEGLNALATETCNGSK